MTTTFSIDLDFCALEAPESDREAMRVEAQAWVDEYAQASGVVATIVDARDGCWPNVRLSSPCPEALLGAIKAYDAGNGEVDDLVAYIERR